MIRDATPLVRVEAAGPVAVITIDRSERHNSLVPPLLEQVIDVLSRAGSDRATRAVVLQAAGRSFSTGGDVRGFWEAEGRRAEYAAEIVGLLNTAMVEMMLLSQPIVGAVHGPVTGGSLGLVLACDVVLVSPEATFTPWYGPVGFAPDGGWTAILPEIIGSDLVDDVLAGNRSITAAEAVEWGMARDLVSGETIQDEALAMARVLAGREIGSDERVKARTPAEVTVIEGRLDDELRTFVSQVTTDEAEAGMARYLGIDPRL